MAEIWLLLHANLITFKENLTWFKTGVCLFICTNQLFCFAHGVGRGVDALGSEAMNLKKIQNNKTR